MKFNVEYYSPLKEGVLSEDGIYIKFSKEVQRGSIESNVFLILDNDSSINGIEDLVAIDEVVGVNLSYSDRTLKIAPREDLAIGRYVLMVRGQIRDIEHNTMMHDLVIPFYVSEQKRKPKITYPIYGEVVESLERIDFVSDGIVRVQISDTKEFNRLFVDKAINSNAKSYMLEAPLNGGINYYIRVGAKDNFSDILLVYVEENVSKELSNVIVQDAVFKAKDIEIVDEYEVEMLPSNEDRIYVSYNKIMIRVNKLVLNIEDVSITLTRLYDYLEEEHKGEDIDFKSISYLTDGEFTYVVAEL